MTAAGLPTYFHVEGEASAVPAGTSDEVAFAVEFQGWLGDDLLDLAGDWIVSGILADALRSSDLTGYELAGVTVTKSDQWALMRHEFELPERWERLVPSGQRRHGDDFAVERTSGLMVSARALALLQSLRLEQADVRKVTSPVFASEEEQAAAEEARLEVLRRQLDERRAHDALERAERDRARQAARVELEAQIASAVEDHRTRHPSGATFTGAIEVARAALGSTIDHPSVAALLAVPTEELEHEVTPGTARETHETWSSRTEGFAAQFTNVTLESVVVYPAWNGPLNREFIAGTDLTDLTVVDLARALGRPDRSTFGARSSFQYDLPEGTLHFGMLDTTVDRVVLKRKKRRKR